MRSIGDVLYNFHWIVPGEAARSAQAYAGMLGPFLTRRGIKGMINLRGNHPHIGWWRYEDRVARARGVVRLDVMLNSRNLPQRGMLVALFNAFEKAPRPFVVKCSGGQDRTSLAAALYLIHRKGWSARAEAEAQFARFPYLHFPKEHQRWLKHFVAFAEQDANGRPIAQWIADTYEPETLRDWLNANGLANTFAGIFALPPGARAQW